MRRAASDGRRGRIRSATIRPLIVSTKRRPADLPSLTYRRSEHYGSECLRLPNASQELALRMIRIRLTPDCLASTVLTPGTLRSSTKLAAGRDQVIGSIARQHALQAYLGNVRVSVRRSWFAGASPARSAGSLTGVAGSDAAPRSFMGPIPRTSTSSPWNCISARTSSRKRLRTSLQVRLSAALQTHIAAPSRAASSIIKHTFTATVVPSPSCYAQFTMPQSTGPTTDSGIYPHREVPAARASRLAGSIQDIECAAPKTLTMGASAST